MHPLVNNTLKVLERIVAAGFLVVLMVSPFVAVTPVYARTQHVVEGVW
jgi:hypothetical protein